MSLVPNRIPPLGKSLIVVGAVVTLLSSAVGFLRALAMSGMSTDQGVPGRSMPSTPLHGMPLLEMPEMFVGAAGIAVVFAAALRSGPAAPNAPIISRRRRIAILVVGTAALTIDISKTSTLGFVIPGMRGEYGINSNTASLLAVLGLAGTATGALLFSRLTHVLGRRNVYLVATLGFTVTSMCGCMPTYTGNLIMCLLMGVSVGGLAPLLITLLADLCAPGARGPVVIALSIFATAVGYLVASASALWLEPVYGWRILWLIGAPTGLLLAAVTFVVPERLPDTAPPASPTTRAARSALTLGLQRAYAILAGLLTFGLTTWVPTLSRASGLTVSTANALLTGAALAMVPCAALLAWGYHRFGPITISGGLAVLTATMLFALALTGAVGNPGWLAAALVSALFAVNTMAAICLPVTADLAGSRGRLRTTGTVSFYNRLGGLAGPVLVATLVTSVTDVLLAVGVLALASALLVWEIGRRKQATAPRARPDDAVARAR